MADIVTIRNRARTPYGRFRNFFNRSEELYEHESKTTYECNVENFNLEVIRFDKTLAGNLLLAQKHGLIPKTEGLPLLRDVADETIGCAMVAGGKELAKLFPDPESPEQAEPSPAPKLPQASEEATEQQEPPRSLVAII